MVTLLYSGYYDLDNSKQPFEVDPNFYYITSCDVPNLLLLTIHSKHYIYIELPEIKLYDQDTFINTIHKCFNAKVLSQREFLQLLKSQKNIHSLPNIVDHPLWNKLKLNTMNLTTLSNKLLLQREIKLPTEISCIKIACKLTSMGIQYIMKHCKPGIYQTELTELFKYYLATKGIDELSFNPITSHNKYNQYLHYRAKPIKVMKGSLILVDLGCKYKNYCSDITRCFPISGKFTILQKNIYKVILNTLKYALSLMKPGSKWSEITTKVQLKIYSQCLDINLVFPTNSNEEKISFISKFMPHSLGHHVGLDIHDCGAINILKPNMIIAVEPGIYFQNIHNPLINYKVWNKYKHLGGVRLEDTILITNKGHKNLSNITKEIHGIEKLMKN